MFAFFKAKKPYEQEARQIYGACLDHVRRPVFYADMGVPDTMDARFDLLVVHVYMVMERLLRDESVEGEVINQTLFDVMFADMDQTLREMGIGDMGVPKRMRKMMTGFNGRVHVYQQAFDASDRAALADAVARNIYADAGAVQKEALAEYIFKQRERLADMDVADILEGKKEIFA
jgi:cytochrome b pre-mRNA-processing protein 3